MAALFTNSLASLERAVSLSVTQNIFGVCVFTGHVAQRERSLAAHVTVALWLSVQWTCCSGEKAGGWYPTYLITDDVHHTSPSSPPRPPARPIDFTAGRPSEKLKGLWAHAQRRVRQATGEGGSTQDAAPRARH